jgi:hypothetical protein
MIKELKSNEVVLVIGGRFLPGLVNVVVKLLFHVTKTSCDEGENRRGC